MHARERQEHATTEPDDKLTKAIEALQQDATAAAEFERVAGDLEAIYQKMLAMGVVRRESYSIVTIGKAMSDRVNFLIYP